ncbi:MAG: alpha/beta hydrolase [Thiohalorhabdus sp.]|uniref:alpha/beta hydrolase n=1 Tax=Thiohalorhabdus sp. TaxID=3094134 RepID=UPI00397F03EB
MQGDSNAPTLARVTLPDAGGPASRAVVWLHGLGADGHDFVPLFQGVEERLPGMRVVLPHAPQQPVTLNGGMRMRAWYDIVSLETTAQQDLEGIRASAERVGGLLDELEEEGIPAERTVLGGFSQGAVLALWAGLGRPRPLAGIAALSGYLPADPPLAEAQRETPIFLGHGRHDGVVPFPLGEAARDRLRALGCSSVTWHPYELDHGVDAEEAGDLLGWLEGVLAERE